MIPTVTEGEDSEHHFHAGATPKASSSQFARSFAGYTIFICRSPVPFRFCSYSCCMKKPPAPNSNRDRIKPAANGHSDPDDFPALAAEDVKAFLNDVILPTIDGLPTEPLRSHYYLSGQLIEERIRFADELQQQTYRVFALGLIAAYERHLREYLIWFGRRLERLDLEVAGRAPRGAVVSVLTQITGFKFERPVGILNEAIVQASVWRHGPGAALDTVYRNTKSRYPKPYVGEGSIDLPRMYGMRIHPDHLTLLARSIQRVWELFHRSRAVRYVPDKWAPADLSNARSKVKKGRSSKQP